MFIVSTVHKSALINKIPVVIGEKIHRYIYNTFIRKVYKIHLFVQIIQQIVKQITCYTQMSDFTACGNGCADNVSELTNEYNK